MRAGEWHVALWGGGASAVRASRPRAGLQVLDRYFGNVCELDLIFNFHKAYHILDELLITGELQEPSKKAILRVTAAQDALMEGSGDSKVSDSKYEI